MYCKLALRNVRRSIRDYTIYFLTLALGVALFYTFNSADGQAVMTYLRQADQMAAVEGILTLIHVLSVFVAAVLAGLILYADRFFIRRRKRELGTWFLLGMERSQVSRILLLETGIIGLLALGAGLLLGVVLSQGLSLLTISLFQVELAEFRLSFSLPAAARTLLYFAVIFAGVMVCSHWGVARARLVDLIQGGRKNEALRTQRTWVSAVLCGVGTVLLLAAYAMLLIRGLLTVDALFWVMLAMGSVGTYLIFRSLFGLLLWLTGRPMCWRGLNVFTLRQWTSRIRTACLSTTVICLMLLLAIGITACAVGLNRTMDLMTANQAPYDVTIENYSGDERWLDLEALLEEGGLTADRFRSVTEVAVYFNDPAITGNEEANAAISLTDYTALSAHNGLPAGEVGMTLDRWGEGLINGGLGLQAVVVDDETARQLPIRRQVWCADCPGAGVELEGEIRTALESASQTNTLMVSTRAMLYLELMGQKVLVLFLGLYLGTTFLLASAAMLALQQLTQAADNVGRYALLLRLGADRSTVGRSVTGQVALAFLTPLLLALIHGAVGLTAANRVIAEVGQVDAGHSVLVTALLLAAVYGGYFLATAAAARRMAFSGTKQG